MTKILINILLLFVLGMTALPVKQVGKLLHSNQLQEETNDDDAQDAAIVVKFIAKDMICLYDGHSFTFSMPVAATLTNFFSFNHGPLLCPPVDIHCPPPNISLV